MQDEEVYTIVLTRNADKWDSDVYNGDPLDGEYLGGSVSEDIIDAYRNAGLVLEETLVVEEVHG